jgi:copper chaperone NosL
MFSKLFRETKPVKYGTIILLISFIFLTACGSQIDPSQPPEIYYGEDVCVECGMIISDPRFAAAYYTTDGSVKQFDDIGGMAVHYVEHEETITQYWVHDFDTEQWLNAEQAYFVMSDQIHSPMDYGIAAFSDEARAKDFASSKNAMVMKFESILDAIAAGTASHEHPDS